MIYNPVSGDGTFKNELDTAIHIFQQGGYLVEIFRLGKNTDVQMFFDESINDGKTIVVAAGGDGTVNGVINMMMRNKIKAPLGIIPAGTANDFGTFLGMPKKVDECCKIIVENHFMDIDVGQVNDEYFINAASGGLLATIPRSTDVRLKNTLGKLGYYIKGLEEIPTFKPVPLSLSSPDYNFEGDLLFFLILNSQFAGGFRNIAPQAQIDDGKFDVILFKDCSLPLLAKLFLKVLKGDHIYDPNVIFFHTSELTINSLQHNQEEIPSDIDGEIGPILPLKIYNKRQALKIIIPKEKSKILAWKGRDLI